MIVPQQVDEFFVGQNGIGVRSAAANHQEIKIPMNRGIEPKQDPCARLTGIEYFRHSLAFCSALPFAWKSRRCFKIRCPARTQTLYPGWSLMFGLSILHYASPPLNDSLQSSEAFRNFAV